jgi:hypothetical protein
MTGTEAGRPDPNELIRVRLLGRAKSLSRSILSRFATAAGDLEDEMPIRALGALDGVETEIANLKTLLRLIDE